MTIKTQAAGLAVEEQSAVRLTPHPLQRVGAHALAAIAAGKGSRPIPLDQLTPDLFDEAVARMTKDAIRAAKAGKDDFWRKSTYALFPNSKINHPSAGKRSVLENEKLIRAWRTMPEPASWPGVPCSLCGADAVGFYGKVDVPLVESELYRNTTPAGHEGLALCWPCVCCFHALPYGCRLTGGPSAAVHSWDDEFLPRATGWRFQRTIKEIELGRPNKAPGRYENELVALVGLRRYELPMRAGVELLVFNNDNRGASIAAYSLEQPLAEWLRSTVRRPELRSGWRELLRAYAFPPVTGVRRLASDAFHRPSRIFTTMVDRLTGTPRQRQPETGVSTAGRAAAGGDDVGVPVANRADGGPGGSAPEVGRSNVAIDTGMPGGAVAGRGGEPDPAEQSRPLTRFHPDLKALCFSYATEVMHVLQKDVDALVALARNIAKEIADENSAGALRGFRAELHRPRRLQNWLERRAVQRLLKSLDPEAGTDARTDAGGGTDGSTGRDAERDAERDASADGDGDGSAGSGSPGPLYTQAQFRLLFDPDERGWLNRSLLLVAVIEELHRLGWRPEDGAELAEAVAAESDGGGDGPPLSAEDTEYLEGTLT
jgi:hypothetical protein